MNINWVDILIILVVFVIMLSGFRSGLIQTLTQVIGLALGLSFAAIYYPLGSNFLIDTLEIDSGIADIISFIFVFFVIYTVVAVLGSLLGLVTYFKTIRIFDRLAGAVAGMGLGIIISGAILFFIITFPLFQGFEVPLGESRFGSQTTDLVEEFYYSIEKVFPGDIPRLAFQPESWKFENDENNLPDSRMIDFAQLDGAACVDCNGAVKFIDYLEVNDGQISPKFICQECERTSDGCQTYEGHHLLYERCPAVLGRQGYRTDCGMWPNGNFVRVTGTCPVCGESGASSASVTSVEEPIRVLRRN